MQPLCYSALYLALTDPCRPVGSGKTALLLALCRGFRDEYNIGEHGRPDPFFFDNRSTQLPTSATYLASR